MVVEGYLESIELFYDEKIKFLSNKDNFISCNNCPNKKEFLEKHDEIILNCGGDGKDCGVKVHIKFPKYLHYERDVKSLNDKLEKELNLEEINKYIDVSSKLKDQKLKKKIIEEKVNEITEQFYKINVENKKDHIYKFYKSRVDKTKKCKEIQKKLNEPLLDGTLKKSLRIEYITLIKKLNEEYREVNEIINTFNPYLQIEAPEVKLEIDGLENKQKKSKKKKETKIKKETKYLFTKGQEVSWMKNDVIFNGNIVVDTTDKKKIIKVKDVNGETVFVPKDIIKVGFFEPEPQIEEPVEEQPIEEEPVEEEPVEEEPVEEIKYFSLSKNNKWLSTFNVANPFKYNGMEYSSVENAFHAQKVDDNDERAEEYRYALSTNVEDPLNPGDAKKFGGKKSFQENGFTLRADWDKVKLRIMKEITREYYLSNQDFRDKLIKTGNKKLVHSGFRIDDYWGVKKTGGENNHGKILMELREELSN
jgi:ribA/ribD-fused uncharacterized protein